MSEFIDTFVKFSNFMSRGGAFDSLSMFVLGGGFLLPSTRVPGVCPGRGIVLDEIDTCIMVECHEVDQGLIRRTRNVRLAYTQCVGRGDFHTRNEIEPFIHSFIHEVV